MKIDTTTQRAFWALRAPEFEAVRRHLEAVHLAAVRGCTTVVDADQWRMLKGRARLAEELLRLINDDVTLS